MSSTTSPTTPSFLPKLALAMGLVSFVGGAVMLFYAAFATLKSADHVVLAQQNLQQVENKWQQVPGANPEALKAVREFAASTLLLARTNFRVKLTLCAVSLVTTASGAVLLLVTSRRKENQATLIS